MSVLTKFFLDWGKRVNCKQRRKKKVRNRNGVTNTNTPCTMPEILNRVLGGHDRRLPEVRLNRFFVLKRTIEYFFYFLRYRSSFFFLKKKRLSSFYFLEKYRWDNQHGDVYFLCIINMQQDWPLRSLIAFEVRERNPLFVLGVLCIIGWPVQLIREVFLRLHLRSSSTHICPA